MVAFENAAIGDDPTKIASVQMELFPRTGEVALRYDLANVGDAIYTAGLVVNGTNNFVEVGAGTREVLFQRVHPDDWDNVAWATNCVDLVTTYEGGYAITNHHEITVGGTDEPPLQLSMTGQDVYFLNDYNNVNRTERVYGTNAVLRVDVRTGIGGEFGSNEMNWVEISGPCSCVTNGWYLEVTPTATDGEVEIEARFFMSCVGYSHTDAEKWRYVDAILTRASMVASDDTWASEGRDPDQNNVLCSWEGFLCRPGGNTWAGGWSSGTAGGI